MQPNVCRNKHVVEKPHLNQKDVTRLMRVGNLTGVQKNAQLKKSIRGTKTAFAKLNMDLKNELSSARKSKKFEPLRLTIPSASKNAWEENDGFHTDFKHSLPARELGIHVHLARTTRRQLRRARSTSNKDTLLPCPSRSSPVPGRISSFGTCASAPALAKTEPSSIPKKKAPSNTEKDGEHIIQGLRRFFENYHLPDDGKHHDDEHLSPECNFCASADCRHLQQCGFCGWTNGYKQDVLQSHKHRETIVLLTKQLKEVGRRIEENADAERGSIDDSEIDSDEEMDEYSLLENEPSWHDSAKSKHLLPMSEEAGNEGGAADPPEKKSRLEGGRLEELFASFVAAEMAPLRKDKVGRLQAAKKASKEKKSNKPGTEVEDGKKKKREDAVPHYMKKHHEKESDDEEGDQHHHHFFHGHHHHHKGRAHVQLPSETSAANALVHSLAESMSGMSGITRSTGYDPHHTNRPTTAGSSSSSSHAHVSRPPPRLMTKMALQSMRRLLLAVLETLPKERTFPPLAVHLMKWLSNETRRVALLSYISKLPQDSVVAVTTGVLKYTTHHALAQLVSTSVRALSIPHKLQILQPIFGKNLREGHSKRQSKRDKEMAHAEIVEGAMSGMELEDKIEALLLNGEDEGEDGEDGKLGQQKSRRLSKKEQRRRSSGFRGPVGKRAVKPGGVSTIEAMSPDERGVLLTKCFQQTAASGRQQLLSSVLAHEHQAVMQSRRLSRYSDGLSRVGTDQSEGEPKIERTDRGGTRFKLKSVVNQLVAQRETAVRAESPLLQAIAQLNLLESAHLLGHLQQRQRTEGLSRTAGGGGRQTHTGRLSPQRELDSLGAVDGLTGVGAKKGSRSPQRGAKVANEQAISDTSGRNGSLEAIEGANVSDLSLVDSFSALARAAAGKSKHHRAIAQARVSNAHRPPFEFLFLSDTLHTQIPRPPYHSAVGLCFCLFFFLG
jgi:hypothetical protein